MKIIPAILVTLVTATAIAGATAFAVTMDPRRSLMSAADYGYEKRAVESQGGQAYARCGAREGQAMALCKAEAIANERVSKADLEAQYRGTTAAFEQAQRVRAQAQ
jgi:hypothetical protein